ncbi:Bifunctional protein GlmU [Pseudovibrio axinellae]|uniref:Bifunctional protein GlmU n=1 Tax=Pseudovibrio axinellae TaxID=989403 RepID=A0A165SYR5_9HYPH|nr:DapH/DapD/GlmU-related protein [Pseudovibrio axinellae]KZL05034.1 Bifunctional protein GlmU [Pseudovibrio axinellae]SER65481.1 transferase hexapeptide (six repeat-containing protein) [Pseudovibrio axinellae]
MQVHEYIANWDKQEFASFDVAPWVLTSNAEQMVHRLIKRIDGPYKKENGQAIHETATIEDGAVLKGPVIIGPNAFVSSRCYLRGGVFLGKGCAVGPFCEVKSSFMLNGSKLAHLGFIGDTILGEGINLEAGVAVANHRNEWKDKEIKLVRDGRAISTGVSKFGALIGDDCKIGANSVLAPGTLLPPGTIIPRLSSVDQQVDHLS